MSDFATRFDAALNGTPHADRETGRARPSGLFVPGDAYEGEPEPEKPPRRWPSPVPLSLLPDRGPVVDWLWTGLIARGHLTLFSALFKAGKTTLIGHALRAFQHGVAFLGRDVKRCRTLVVSEESEAIWRGRRDALCLDDSVSVQCRPFIARPMLADWLEFVAELADDMTAGGFDLVVLDTISAFAPWKSENDSAEVMATLTPLNRLTKSGCAVLLFHHHGKADSSEGRAARGSTALAGAADILIELRRYKPDDADDRRRVIAGLGRFDEIPTEIVITLNEDGNGYTADGDKRAVAARELADAIADVLPTEPPGLKADEVHCAMDEDGRPKLAAVRKALQTGADSGAWNRTGTGKPPKDPHRFWRPY